MIKFISTFPPLFQAMKKLFLLPGVILILCGVTTLQAQLQPKNCITDLLHERLKTTNPTRAAREQQINQLVYENIRNGNIERAGDIIIQVVIHIIHQNGPENISDAMVMRKHPVNYTVTFQLPGSNLINSDCLVSGNTVKTSLSHFSGFIALSLQVAKKE